MSISKYTVMATVIVAGDIQTHQFKTYASDAEAKSFLHNMGNICEFLTTYQFSKKLESLNMRIDWMVRPSDNTNLSLFYDENLSQDVFIEFWIQEYKF